MTEVIGVRFKKVGKTYYFDPGMLEPLKGTPIIVETSRGIECGEVIMERREVDDEKIVKPLKTAIRIATAADLLVIEQNERFEHDAYRICEERIKKHGLEMKLVAVEYTFDRSKILFYFSAEGRVDFRELVKDLASIFRTRIELRQIGVRDEAKMVGGLGICGRPLCCNTFLSEFQPVSINMAKEQGLPLNPTKISGACGRLMCCLKYECEAYQDLIQSTPQSMSLVDTPSGRGVVLESNMLKGVCKVQLRNNQDAPPVIVPCSECKILRQGRERIDIPADTTVTELPVEEPECIRPSSNESVRITEKSKQNDDFTASLENPLTQTEDESSELPQKRRRRSHRGGRGRNKANHTHVPGSEPSSNE